MSEKEWYDNKELFSLINELKVEMVETRHMIKKYNGLYDKVGSVKDSLNQLNERVNTIEDEELLELKEAKRYNSDNKWKIITSVAGTLLTALVFWIVAALVNGNM